MSPRAFFEDRLDTIIGKATMSYSGGNMEVHVYGKLPKSALSEEDLILMTCVEAAFTGGIMPSENYSAIRDMLVFSHPQTQFSTSLGGSLRELDRLKGTNTGQKVIDDVKRDAMPLPELREEVYDHVVFPLMRSQSTDPEIVYLKQLCQRLPRSVGGIAAARQTSPF